MNVAEWHVSDLQNEGRLKSLAKFTSFPRVIAIHQIHK